MYLLKLIMTVTAIEKNRHSHSTMYLLKPVTGSEEQDIYRIHIPPCIY